MANKFEALTLQLEYAHMVHKLGKVRTHILTLHKEFQCSQCQNFGSNQVHIDIQHNGHNRSPQPLLVPNFSS